MRPLTWMAVVGISLAALGCGGGSGSPCAPDLTVNWAIVDSNSNTPASCRDVGASSIRVTIDGQSMDFTCPSAQSSGSILAQLGVSGTHTVAVTLLDGTAPIGQDVSLTSNVDCSGLSETPVLTLAAPVGCTSNLTISWDIVSALDGNPRSCAQAGNADTVNAQIDGGGLSALMDFPGTCASGATSGSFLVQLPSAGRYNVSLQLKSGSTVLSETPVLTQTVDCSGQSATPLADLSVNF